MPTNVEIPVVVLEASAQLPTRFGNFTLLVFASAERPGVETVALVHGDLRAHANPLVRLHSECLTGDVMGSLRCDCADQLAEALQRIADEPAGAVVYLRQEGRGIGLTNMIRAYALQERGLDTVDANHALGFDADERDYALAASVLGYLGIPAMRLMTNNPEKLRQLTLFGLQVTREPLSGIDPKARRLGHEPALKTFAHEGDVR